jgi:hypothetical protein
VLPDGIFSIPKSPIWADFGRSFLEILEGLAMADVGIYFMAVLSTSLTHGIYYGRMVHYLFGNWVYFFPFWYAVPRKIWQPCTGAGLS